MATPNDPTMSHDSLDAVIAGYMLAVEGGEVPNRQDLLDRHPEHADALLAFFADLDRMDRVASPLRLAGGLGVTGAADANGHAARPTVRYFGDYELLEEVARGGMGIVYKARQVSLNRLVALKMILAGSFASTRDIQRFRTEAESAANLDHPHIVPIHEVGEHEGQQYYSMKFVEGTSLAGHPRGELRAEVASLVDVALRRASCAPAGRAAPRPEALERARGFTGDAAGRRLRPGEALRHRRCNVHRNRPGAGHAEVHCAEQAAGRKDLTVAADVYSLGVILYERLTGQTPFTGDNALTLLRQARESEPPRPSSIRPGLDRDLETVVLKCLEKEPGRRYPSAEALADDLANWLAGRPIAARPVGQAERFWRWCRRNPAVAGLTAAVASALILGAVVSTFFALAERRGRIRAERAEQETERTFAQSLVRPLDPDGDEGYDEADLKPLSGPETGALWELSLQQGKPIGLRFLEEATRDPLDVRQLRARSEPVLIAAVGLDTDRRERASSILSERLHEQGRPLWSKAEVGFVALELEDTPGPASEEYAGIILQALGGDHPENLMTSWRHHLVDAATRLDPSIAARLLVAAMEPKTQAYDRFKLAVALATVANRLEPAEAARICGQAVQILLNALALDKGTGRDFSVGALRELSARLEPVHASRVSGQVAQILSDALSDALARETNAAARERLAMDLASVSERLEPAEAARLCGRAASTLVVALEREKDANGYSSLAYCLQSLASRMEPAEAARVCGSAARLIIPSLERIRWTGSFGRNQSPSYEWVSSLVRRMDPAEAASLLTLAVERAEKADVRDTLVRNLVSVAGRLGRGEEKRICRQAARFMVAALGREKKVDAHPSLAEGLGVLVARLDKVEAAELCGQAAQVLAVDFARETDADTLESLARGLASVSTRLDPAEAARLCGRATRSLADALEHEKAYKARHSLASGLVSLSGLADRSKVSSALIAAVKREANNRLALDLALLAGRSDQAEATRICGQAARSLAEAIVRETDWKVQNEIRSGLASLANRMAPTEAASVLSAARKQASNLSCLKDLTQMLLATLNRLDAAEARRYCEQLIGSLDRGSLESVAPELLPQLDPGRAHALAGVLASRMCSKPLTWPEAQDLSRILTDTSREQKARRAARMASAGSGIIGMLEAAKISVEPYPCRLTTQELVDLLKMPTCFGEARREVLDHLGDRYGRRFINHWAFVRFARERNLGLDFTTPPKRPDPKESVKRMLEILHRPS